MPRSWYFNITATATQYFFFKYIVKSVVIIGPDVLNGASIPNHEQNVSDIEEVPFINWYVVIAPVNSLGFPLWTNCKFRHRNVPELMKG